MVQVAGLGTRFLFLSLVLFLFTFYSSSPMSAQIARVNVRGLASPPRSLSLFLSSASPMSASIDRDGVGGFVLRPLIPSSLSLALVRIDSVVVGLGICLVIRVVKLE